MEQLVHLHQTFPGPYDAEYKAIICLVYIATVIFFVGIIVKL